MMDLNLLPSQAKFQAKKISLKKKVILSMEIMAGVWVFGLVVLFLVFLLVKGKNESEDRKLKKAQDQLKGLNENIVMTQKLKLRAKLVGKVLTSRFEYGESFKAIGELLPKEVTISKMDLMDKSKFSLEGNTKSFGAVNEMEKLVRDINEGRNDKFARAVMKSLTFNQSSGWKVQMEVSIK